MLNDLLCYINLLNRMGTQWCSPRLAKSAVGRLLFGERMNTHMRRKPHQILS